jgi:hypothetical protein
MTRRARNDDTRNRAASSLLRDLLFCGLARNPADKVSQTIIEESLHSRYSLLTLTSHFGLELCFARELAIGTTPVPALIQVLLLYGEEYRAQLSYNDVSKMIARASEAK